MFKFELNQRLAVKRTGRIGTVRSRTEYIGNLPNEYLIQYENITDKDKEFEKTGITSNESWSEDELAAAVIDEASF